MCTRSIVNVEQTYTMTANSHEFEIKSPGAETVARNINECYTAIGLFPVLFVCHSSTTTHLQTGQSGKYEEIVGGEGEKCNNVALQKANKGLSH